MLDLIYCLRKKKIPTLGKHLCLEPTSCAAVFSPHLNSASMQFKYEIVSSPIHFNKKQIRKVTIKNLESLTKMTPKLHRSQDSS